jgi:polar amino acid transport system substrate-binding protein
VNAPRRGGDGAHEPGLGSQPHGRVVHHPHIQLSGGDTLRRFLAFLTVCLLAMGALAACSSDSDSNDTSSGSGPYEYINDDTLTVGTNLPAPGFWEGESPDDVTGGFEYELAVEAAERLNLSKGAKVVNVSFDALQAGQAKGFDVALSQVTITDERAEVVDFSEPYLDSNQGVMVLSSYDQPITTDAEAKELQWGIQSGTVADGVLKQLGTTKEPRQYPETSQMFAALQAKQVDAVMTDTTILLAQANEDGGQTFKVVAQFESGEKLGGVFPKGSKFRAAFDKVLREMIDDGTVAQLAKTQLEPTFGKSPNDVPVIPLP